MVPSNVVTVPVFKATETRVCTQWRRKGVCEKPSCPFRHPPNLKKDDTRPKDGSEQVKKDKVKGKSESENTTNPQNSGKGGAVLGPKDRSSKYGICKFFLTPRGCLKGDECNFSHLGAPTETEKQGLVKSGKGKGHVSSGNRMVTVLLETDAVSNMI